MRRKPNPSFTELKYALFHKPTKKWVAFRNAGLELTRTIITLVTFQKATIAAAPNYLIATLKDSSLHSTPYYGKENFLEFDTIEIEVTYTVKH